MQRATFREGPVQWKATSRMGKRIPHWMRLEPAPQSIRSECDPPTRLTFTWRALWSEEAAGEEPSRVSFQVEPMGGVCRLRVVHDSFPEDSKVLEEGSQGWSGILCSLKSLRESGEGLRLAGNQ